MAISNALQHGTPLEDLVRLFKGQKFEPSGLTSNPTIRSCSSVPDYIVRYLESKFTAPVWGKSAVPVDVEKKEEMNEASRFLRPRKLETLGEIEFLKPFEAIPEPSYIKFIYPDGDPCPDCGAVLVSESACLVCKTPGCGYSRC
jgi:hypothetical protein